MLATNAIGQYPGKWKMSEWILGWNLTIGFPAQIGIVYFADLNGKYNGISAIWLVKKINKTKGWLLTNQILT
jgi:hypothetical protein